MVCVQLAANELTYARIYKLRQFMMIFISIPGRVIFNVFKGADPGNLNVGFYSA